MHIQIYIYAEDEDTQTLQSSTAQATATRAPRFAILQAYYLHGNCQTTATSLPFGVKVPRDVGSGEV